MWKIKQIFDGDFGCEELAPGERPKVSVTLENEEGQTKLVSVEEHGFFHALKESAFLDFR